MYAIINNLYKGVYGELKNIIKYGVFILLIIFLIISCTGSLSQNVNYRRTFSSDDIIFPDEENQMDELSLMYYNIRFGKGMDGKLDIHRIYEVIKFSQTDIIGLSEVDWGLFRSGRVKQAEYLSEKLNMNYAFGSAIDMIEGSYGNAIISRFPLTKINNYRLPLLKEDDEPRALLEATTSIPGQGKVRIMVTHLTLDRKTRLEQLKWIRYHIRENVDEEFILLGDFNGSIKPLLDDDINYKTVPTFPSRGAESEIDYIISSFDLKNEKVIETEASDHLPLLTDVSF